MLAMAIAYTPFDAQLCWFPLVFLLQFYNETKKDVNNQDMLIYNQQTVNDHEAMPFMQHDIKTQGNGASAFKNHNENIRLSLELPAGQSR